MGGDLGRGNCAPGRAEVFCRKRKVRVLAAWRVSRFRRRRTCKLRWRRHSLSCTAAILLQSDSQSTPTGAPATTRLCYRPSHAPADLERDPRTAGQPVLDNRQTAYRDHEPGQRARQDVCIGSSVAHGRDGRRRPWRRPRRRLERSIALESRPGRTRVGRAAVCFAQAAPVCFVRGALRRSRHSRTETAEPLRAPRRSVRLVRAGRLVGYLESHGRERRSARVAGNYVVVAVRPAGPGRQLVARRPVALRRPAQPVRNPSLLRRFAERTSPRPIVTCTEQPASGPLLGDSGDGHVGCRLVLFERRRPSRRSDTFTIVRRQVAKGVPDPPSGRHERGPSHPG